VADGAHARVLVIGLGNELRGDDAAGVVVARRFCEAGVLAGVAVLEEHGEPIGLLEEWRPGDGVVLVDAMRSGAAPGTCRRLDATCAPLPGELDGAPSTHAVGLGQVVELGRALGRFPRRLVVHAVEGRRFDYGAGLSDEVEAAIPGLVEAVVAEVTTLQCAVGAWVATA
jgi:hydrogenase maturation protease